MRLSEIPDRSASAVKAAGARLSDLITPTLRLGVTGLAQSGKTVFITSLVRNLIAGGRLPFFTPMAEGRILRAYLEPQPDDRVPRFSYEEHLAELGKDPPQWPASTRRISQLRLTIEYTSRSAVRRALAMGRLHVDIVDYPGEWLIDLPLLNMSFVEWSRHALAQARERPEAAEAWLEFQSTLDPHSSADEQIVLRGAELFTRYIGSARSRDAALSAPGPGRFLLPGDLADSPLLTFFPLPPSSSGDTPARGTLGAMLARRFESYKSHVVKPFFRDHFARIDRQIVLVDALSAINGGAPALDDLERTLEAVLKCFRPGANTWLSSILARRVERLVFAATKADHLHHTSHDRLEAILRALADQAIARAQLAGAGVKTVALAALRSTREAEARQKWQRLPCIVGVPIAGEKLGRKVFNGTMEAAVFPGDLPADPAELRRNGHTDAVSFLRFSPPRINLNGVSGEAEALPHIRLDRAMDFLLGDKLS